MGDSSGFALGPQVVAVVMDMFTDVDLLSEVLEAAARRVPVYILLDEMNAQHFLDTAEKCRVNLHHVDVSDAGGGGGGREGREGGKTPPPNASPSPVPAGAHRGRPHLLLPHGQVLQGPREGEVPLGGLRRGDEWELQVRSPSTAPPGPPPPVAQPSRPSCLFADLTPQALAAEPRPSLAPPLPLALPRP